MPEDNTPPAEEIPTDPAEIEAAPEEVVAPEVTDTGEGDGLPTIEAALAILGKGKAAKAEAPAEEPVVDDDPLVDEPPADDPAPADDAPPVDDNPPADVDPEPPKDSKDDRNRKRVSLDWKKDGRSVFNDIDRAAIALVADEAHEGNFISLDQAKARLLGKEDPAAEKVGEKPAPKAEPVPGSAEIGKAIDAKLDEIEQAGEAMETAKMGKLQRELRKLETDERAAIERERAAAHDERQAAQTFEQTVGQSMEKAAGFYPDAVKEGSNLHAAIAAEVRALEKRADPILRDAKWPVKVAAYVAAELGIAPKAAKPAEAAKPAKPATPAAKPTVPLRRAVPVPSPGGVSGGSPNTEAKTITQLHALTEAGNLDGVLALKKQHRAMEAAKARAKAA